MTGLRKLLATEAKLMLREAGWVFTAGIPVFVLVVFGLVPAGAGADAGGAGLELLVAMTMAINLGLVALYMVPTTLATYRERGILRRLSTTPVHPATLLTVQLVLQLALALASAALLVVVARVAFDVALPRGVPALLGVYALGTVAMFAVGLLIAAVAPSGRLANGIGVLLYFPSAFLAGLMLPKDLMPAALARAGEFTPLGALRQSLLDAWHGAGPDPLLMAIMAGYALIVSVAAARLFRWE
jgi:ABC-2 type transport system permease protein